MQMNIYESINAVMQDVKAVGKDSRNSTQGFMFRGIDAVMNAINPALVKNKVFVVPEVLDLRREERTNAKGTTLIYAIAIIKYTFFAEDGSCVSAVTIGEGMDTGDKAANKAMAIAFKYALFQTFCIPTEEMRDADPDYESHEVKAKTEPKKDTKVAKVDGHMEIIKFFKGKSDAYKANVLNHFGVAKVEDMNEAQVKEVLDWINKQEKENK